MSCEPETEPIERLYKIQNNVYSYFTGFLSNGNQVLMGSADTNSNGKKIETPTFPLVEFDKDGNLLGVYTEETGPPFSPLRFTPGTITIKKFFISDQWIGITDLPEHYQDFLDHPEDAAEYERSCYPEEIEGWRKSGEFVLDFDGGDFFLSIEGELESS